MNPSSRSGTAFLLIGAFQSNFFLEFAELKLHMLTKMQQLDSGIVLCARIGAIPDSWGKQASTSWRSSSIVKTGGESVECSDGLVLGYACSVEYRV